jgi:hypothetical protein
MIDDGVTNMNTMNTSKNSSPADGFDVGLSNNRIGING